MTTLTDLLSGASNGLMAGLQNPVTQLGIQLLGAGGWQPGNVSTGQRLAGAFNDFQNMNAKMQALQQQAELRKIQTGVLQQRQLEYQRQQQQQQGIAKYVNEHPEFLQQYPLARLIAGMNGDLGQASEAIKTTQDPNAPNRPFQYQQQNPDGTTTTMTYDPASGQYQAGTPYTSTERINAMTGQKNSENNAINAETNRQRLTDEQAVRQQQMLDKQKEAAQKAQAAQLKQNTTQINLASTYRNQDAAFNQDINDALAAANSPYLDRIYGKLGMLPNIPGGKAADLQALIDKIVAGASLGGLVKLEKQGVKLTPVSEADRQIAGQSLINLKNAQSPASAKKALQDYADAIKRVREDATNTFNQTNSLYGQGGQSSQRTIQRTGTDQNGRKVIQYSDGSIEYAN